MSGAESAELPLDEIIRLRKAKYRWKDIANEIGVIYPSTVLRAMRSNPNFPPDLFENVKGVRASAEEIQSMMSEGMTDRQIAAELEMKLESFQRLRLRRGINRSAPAGQAGGRKTPQELAEISELLDEGYSYSAICELKGTTHETLRRHFPGRGFTNEQSREVAMMSRKLNALQAFQ